MPSGQASAEYVALLALVAVVLAAAAGRAVGFDAAAIPGAVLHHARVAICIAGGDVCRSSDAEREGLAPCVRSAREGRQVWEGVGLSILSGRDGRAYAIEQRSDGRVAVSAIKTRGIGLQPGIRSGRRATFSAGADAALERTERWTWVLADAAAARAFLRRLPEPHVIESDRDWRFRDLPEPTEHYTAGGVAGSLVAAVAGGVALPLLEAGGRESIGRETRPDGTTWVYDAAGVGTHIFGGLLPAVHLRRASNWRLEVTERDGRASAVVVRATLPGDRPDEEVRVRARLDTRAPENAAVARDLLALEEAVTPAAILRARRAGEHIRRFGAIEREVHRVQSRRWGVNGGVQLPMLALERDGEHLTRTLVAADVLRPDGWRSVRRDCLGL